MTDANSDRISLDAPVREVTLLEDRAVVTRVGRVSVPAGLSRLRVAAVAPVLADKTLEARVEGARLIDARCGRKLLTHVESSSSEHAAVVKLQRENDHAAAKLRTSLQERSRELQDRTLAREHWAKEVGDDVAWGQKDPARWAESLDAALAAEIVLRESLALDHARVAELDRLAQDLAVRAAATKDPSSQRLAWIDIDIQADASGTAEIRLTYVVPAAMWRPQHRALLERDGDGFSVRWQIDACVWQRTGEAWEDAALTFSTERPSLGVQPPDLGSDILRVRKKQEQLQVEAREQTVATTGLGSDKNVLDQLPGVADGGSTVRLKSHAAATVPSDGRPHRIRIAEISMPASRRTVLLAELSPMAILETTQAWAAESPLLAGPVDLVREGVIAGRTKVMFAAPGEKFALGWGPETSIRVQREVTRLDGKTRMLSSWIKVPHQVRLKLSNLGAEPVTLEVTERLPVSELREVEIEVDRGATTGGASPDDDGFVRWTVTVPPHGRDVIALDWTLAKKDDVKGI